MYSMLSKYLPSYQGVGMHLDRVGPGVNYSHLLSLAQSKLPRLNIICSSSFSSQ